MLVAVAGEQFGNGRIIVDQVTIVVSGATLRIDLGATLMSGLCKVCFACG
jgi:hypothetical protein